MAKKYIIETFGCQMNVHDSERMAGLLDQAGYEPTNDDLDADVIVINTCSVREHAEEKLYTRLGELRVLGDKTGRRPMVAVAGCVAQQEGRSLLSGTNGHVIDVVVGTQRLKMLPVLLEKATDSAFAEVDINPWDDVSFPLGIARRADPVKAYVTIIEGCNDHCAFCVVPHTRGHERMRAKADILADVRQAADSGRREVQLLGQIVNHYRAPDDPACDFAQLLAEGRWRSWCRTHPIRKSASTTHRRAAHRGSPGPAEGMQTYALARPVGFHPGATRHATPALARGIRRSDEPYPRGYSGRDPIDRYYCWLSRREGRRFRSDALAG